MYLYKGERGTKNIAAFFVPLGAFIVFFVFNPNRSLDRSTVLFFLKESSSGILPPSASILLPGLP